MGKDGREEGGGGEGVHMSPGAEMREHQNGPEVVIALT